MPQHPPQHYSRFKLPLQNTKYNADGTRTLWPYINLPPLLSRKLQLPKSWFDVHAGSRLLFHHRLHTWHYFGYLVLYHVLVRMECSSRSRYDRWVGTKKNSDVHVRQIRCSLEIIIVLYSSTVWHEYTYLLPSMQLRYFFRISVVRFVCVILYPSPKWWWPVQVPSEEVSRNESAICFRHGI